MGDVIDGNHHNATQIVQGALEYARWESFEKVIDKAKISCEQSGNAIVDHFHEVTKKVNLGSDVTERAVTHGEPRHAKIG